MRKDLQNKLINFVQSLPAGVTMSLHDVPVGTSPGPRVTVIVLSENGVIPDSVALDSAVQDAILAAAHAADGVSPKPASDPEFNGERYSAGLEYVVDGHLKPDGHEDETNAPYYFGHSAITAFEAGAVWQAQRGTEKKEESTMACRPDAL